MTSILAAATDTAPAAGGAAIGQVVIATLGAIVATSILLVLGIGHRTGRVSLLGRVSGRVEQLTGLPGWVALPSLLVGVSLITALFGMMWDISLHIDDGRDEGPLANPAHYFILAGLFGVFAAGFIGDGAAGGEAEPDRDPASAGTGTRRSAAIMIAACGELLADRLPARRHLAPPLRPGRHPLGPDAPDAARRRGDDR